MRVAILHFHLRPGGVTRVIEMAAEALTDQGCDVLVVSGEPAPAGCRLPMRQVAVVPELRYGVAANAESQLRTGVEEAMTRQWGAAADVLHFHNHSLGKNFALPPAITHWAGEGRHLLLQIHDFAEDGRPANYRALLRELGGLAGLDRYLYPAASHVSYAMLNTADFEKFPQANSHLLPNPVVLPAANRPIERALFQAERVIVYPTRAIRRKNIGEAILWAAWAAPGEKIVLTSAPEAAADARRHQEWQAFAEALGLPVIFDAQRQFARSTADFLHAADVCLTTSVAEGFGMAFLEPWLAGKSVVGRDLPRVTADFKRASVRLDQLYPRLEVRPDGIEATAILQAIEAQVSATCAAYELPVESRFVGEATASVLRPEGADFGRLDESLQRIIIEGVVRARQRWSLPEGVDATVNRELIERDFSLKKYGVRLEEIYRQLLRAESGPLAHLKARDVLRRSLSFDDFTPLRS